VSIEPTALLPDSLLDRIEVLSGRPRRVTELAGGLTNRNYKVSTPEGDYVVRVSSNESSELAVNRDHEHRNTVIAASTGVGAPVHAYLPEDNVLVIGFLEGRTYSDASFAEPGAIAKVAAACRRLHDGPRFVNDFNMFEIQARYLATVLEHGYRLPKGYLDHRDKVPLLRQALAVRAASPVACNNDLLAGNFIEGPDGVHLIDYEYSGNNDACFELGNIWSECHLDESQLEELVSEYYGRRLEHAIARAKLQGLMSQYGWTLWASIQDAQSRLDFDFWSWGMEKYERAVSTFTSRGLDDLLERAQRAD
jgi:thiamine kinase-like enzyme